MLYLDLVSYNLAKSYGSTRFLKTPKSFGRLSFMYKFTDHTLDVFIRAFFTHVVGPIFCQPFKTDNQKTPFLSFVWFVLFCFCFIRRKKKGALFYYAPTANITGKIYNNNRCDKL